MQPGTRRPTLPPVCPRGLAAREVSGHDLPTTPTVSPQLTGDLLKCYIQNLLGGLQTRPFP